jgi:hypothetical protein
VAVVVVAVVVVAVVVVAVAAAANGVQCHPGGQSNPQPPQNDPLWQGHTDGAIYDCVVPDKIGPGLFLAGYTIQYWALTAPPQPPNPETLARQAIATMNLRAITIGMVPESRPGSVGLVGVPNWMWVDQPAANTWGPITRSASAAGWTVTATAQVSKVTWDMGDSAPIVCNGPGTPYEDSYGKSASPTCGHTYTRQGTYTVRATSHWVITWSGIGETGTITMDLTQTAPVTIGEAQVLKQ